MGTAYFVDEIQDLSKRLVKCISAEGVIRFQAQHFSTVTELRDADPIQLVKQWQGSIEAETISLIPSVLKYRALFAKDRLREFGSRNDGSAHELACVILYRTLTTLAYVPEAVSELPSDWNLDPNDSQELLDHYWNKKTFPALLKALTLLPPYDRQKLVDNINVEMIRAVRRLTTDEPIPEWQGMTIDRPEVKPATSTPEAKAMPAADSLAEASLAATPADAPLALLRVFTNGIADDRIKKAIPLLADDKLTVNEKLTKIDALIRFPATASAEQLGEMLGVTKQAVLKTDWWIQNRHGQKASEVGRRRDGHRKRAESYEAHCQDDEEG